MRFKQTQSIKLNKLLHFKVTEKKYDIISKRVENEIVKNHVKS